MADAITTKVDVDVHCMNDIQLTSDLSSSTRKRKTRTEADSPSSLAEVVNKKCKVANGRPSSVSKAVKTLNKKFKPPKVPKVTKVTKPKVSKYNDNEQMNM